MVSVFFGIMLLIVPVAIIGGLFSPEIFHTDSRKKVLQYGFLIWASCFFLLIVFSPSSEKKEPTLPTPQPTETKNDPIIQQPVTQPVQQVVPKVEPVQEIKPVTVTSKVVYSDYQDNEVAADMKYKGKIIDVTGKISGIGNGTFDNELTIKLEATNPYNYVSCVMTDSEKEKVITLKKGQTITIRGTGKSATLGTPYFEDCTIVK